MKGAWVPVLAPLLSIVAEQESPDQVRNDFMAIGFNFILPTELQDRFGPRKRAYISEVQGWINDLDWTSQWELARALANRLSEKSSHLVSKRLSGVGWRFDGKEFVPIETGEVKEHVFFPAGAEHDAFVHIRSLFKGATDEIFVVDGYLDSSLFRFLLSTNGPKICRILTKTRNLPSDFVHECNLFVRQHSFRMAIRTSDLFHDRQIILDGTRAFILGASIKDAGKKAFHIVPIQNPSVRNEMIRYLEEVWSNGKSVF